MERSVWSCYSHVFAVSEDALYGDRYGERYEYDSNVVNSSRIREGDILLIRDAQLIFGFGVVERIDAAEGEKLMQRCRVCRRAALSRRMSATPEYRCLKCKAEFDEPLVEPLVVTKFVAHYGQLWIPLPSPAPVRQLLGVYAQRDRQNAIRRLDATAAERLMGQLAGIDGLFFVQISHAVGPPGGFIESVARARRGQVQFRQGLVDRFGAVCAVTGPQPEQVLDAAHLYSYAKAPHHDPHGGLLLRADIHRLFDRLVLTIDPKTWRARVDPGLADRFALLRELADREVVLDEAKRPRTDLVNGHFELATRAWKDRRGT
ncbi:HNH endonuclease [Cellulosimicrobium cellulans]|uniref:HNH endonuclease n=1 Tax=Cellulosimicrobium cellulans TaxID=1710 RepID=UPI0035D5E993